MNIGFLVSGEGYALECILRLIKNSHSELNLYGFSDRHCRAYDIVNKYCDAAGIIDSTDNGLISMKAYKFFKSCKCEIVFVLYSRLIRSILFENIKCINIHPSLLPNYKGFDAINRAYTDQVKDFGASLHYIDSSIDSGPSICQIKTSPSIYSLDYWYFVSYLLKIILVTAYLDNIVGGVNTNAHCECSFSPYISESFSLIDVTINQSLLELALPVVQSSNAASFRLPFPRPLL